MSVKQLEIEGLQAENQRLKQWQDLAFELLSEIRQWTAPGSITDLQAPLALKALMRDREERGERIAELERDIERLQNEVNDVRAAAELYQQRINAGIITLRGQS